MATTFAIPAMDKLLANGDGDGRRPSKQWIRPSGGRRILEDWVVEGRTARIIEGPRPSKVIVSNVLAPELAHILRVIQDSRWILALEENWDGEGAIPYSEDTFKQATAFLRNYAIHSLKRFGTAIAAPRILPGPDGSIDLHWKRHGHELLVNIPASSEQLASFYGDDFGSAQIKGTFDVGTYNLGLLGWLTEHCK